MNVQKALELGAQIQQIQALMIDFVTGKQTPEQPAQYQDLYATIQVALEEAKYARIRTSR